MKFLANENFPAPSIHRLRDADYDVASIIEDSRDVSDREVLDRAVREDRIVLTFDRDYGELIYRLAMPAPVGVIFFRYFPPTPEEPAERLLTIVGAANLKFDRYFTVIELN